MITYLEGTSLPGEDRRLAFLAEQIRLAVRHLRAEDLRMAGHELIQSKAKEIRHRHRE